MSKPNDPIARLVLWRFRRLDPDTGHYRRLSDSQKEVKTAHARQGGPGAPALMVVAEHVTASLAPAVARLPSSAEQATDVLSD